MYTTKARNDSQKPETSRKNQKPMAKRSGTFAEHSPQPKARQEKKEFKPFEIFTII
jgi:hypothetical protein